MAVIRRWGRSFIVQICMAGVLLFALPLSSALADDAGLSNIIVTNTRDDLLIYMNVEGAFTDDMKTAIMSGVPATFSFVLILNRTRKFWLDEELADFTITHTIKYHTMKNEFSVKRSWEEDQIHVVKSFSEARQLMTQVDGIKVVSLEVLEKGSQYQIQAKAELDKVTLPFYLHYVLFFLSLWDFETDWYTIDFVY